jgi:hypothetical protein
MGRWSDLAQWRGPTVNQSGAMVEQRGLVVHIAEGTYEGTIAWQKNPDSNVSSHFIVGIDGAIAQMVDTDRTAWTQRAGNGHWLSVENAGHTPNPLTAAQIEANAQLLARAHREYGVPLQLAENPDGKGLGHHSMGCNWPGGAWGHCDCPGPAIIAQKPAILARAIAITEGDDMALSERDAQALIWRVEAILHNRPTVADGPTKGERNELHDRLAELGVVTPPPGPAPTSGTFTGTFTTEAP